MTEETQNIGTRLRVARELSGLTLRQIADTTKLSIRSLEALEHDRISHLPGGIYRRAIVRAYAREIGLNPEVILREFLAAHPDDLPPLPPLPTRKPTSYDLPPAAPEPVRNRPRLWRALLSVIGAIVPVSAGVFYFTIGFRGADAPRHVADFMPPGASEPWQPQILQAGAGASLTMPLARPLAVMISVSSRCDLQVVADGQPVVSRTMEAGEVVQLSLRDEIVLAGSNAGAVHVSFNGRAGRPLGIAGAPLDVRIDRDDYDSWLAQ